MNQILISARPVDQDADIILSPEQEHVLQIIKSGRNVFFTGSAGTLPVLHQVYFAVHEMFQARENLSCSAKLFVTCEVGIL